VADYELREVRDGDADNLSALASVVWQEEVPPAYWGWKYRDNPWGTGYSYVAEANGTIVGFVGGMVWQLRVTGRHLTGVQTTDMMLHPDWRKRGVFFPLNRLHLDEIRERADYHCGWTNPMSVRIYRRFFRYDGFSPTKIQKPTALRAVLFTLAKDPRGAAAGALRKVCSRRVPRRAAGGSGDTAVREVASFDARTDDLWGRLQDRYRVATPRTSRYLNWRYVANPRTDYTIFAAGSESVLNGFVVLKCEQKDGVRRGFIVDALMPPDNDAAADGLLRAARRFFRKQKTVVVNGWMCGRHALAARLAAQGFRARTADTVVLLAKVFADGVPEDFLSDGENWYYTMGDCDAF